MHVHDQPGELVKMRSEVVDATDLFLFSAACWLPHRIHYDAAFAHDEGWLTTPVQGPLLAALLSEMVSAWAREQDGRLVAMAVRNVRPAYPGDQLTLQAHLTGRTPQPSGHVCSLAVCVADGDEQVKSRGTADVWLPVPST